MDRIKEELAWLRTLMPLAVAVDVGLIAYMYQATTPRRLAVVAAVVLAGTFGVTGWVIVSVYRLLTALEPRS